MREDIEKYLGTVQQSTAKTIADRIGVDRLDVARELNHMVGDGLVEREKRPGGGNEYVYWLARGEAAQPPAAAPNPKEPQQQVAKQEAFDPPEFREVDRPLSELFALIGVDPSITDIPVWHAIEMVRGLQAINEAGLQAKAALDAQIAALQSDLANERAEVESEKSVIAKLRANNAELERRIDELTLVDAEFVPSQVFVTIGRYAAPKRHRTLEKAQRRAHLLVRSEKESEVLVLEPVGRVVRGAEWRSQ